MFFVYYTDDYYDNGGVGMKKFHDKDEALKFIDTRLKSEGCLPKELENYCLIEGKVLLLKAETVVTKVTTA